MPTGDNEELLKKLQRYTEKYNLNPKWVNYVDNPQEIIDAVETYEFFQNSYLSNSAQIPENRLSWACHTKLYVKYVLKFARGMVPPRVDGWSDDDLEEYYKAVIKEYSIDSRYLPYFMEEGFRFYWFIQAWNEAAAIEYPMFPHYQSPEDWIIEEYDLTKPTKKQIEEENEAKARYLVAEEERITALEETTTAEPTFRDLPIAWENVTTEEDGTQRTGHWIVWNGNRSKREAFFKLAFPDQYNKVKKRVKFLEQAADDVLRLTGGQRTKLMYEILAWKYELEEVSEQDSFDLIHLCQREEDNKTADDLLSRLRWPNGLAKLVTFGVGMKLDSAAQHTWCYTVDYQEDRAVFEGSSMTWERWQVKLIEILDRCRACRCSYPKMWK